MRLEFISRLFFASTQNPAIVGAIVEAQIAKVEHELKNHERLLADLGPENLFNRLSLELRICQLGAQRAWLENNVRLLVPQGLSFCPTSIHSARASATAVFK